MESKKDDLGVEPKRQDGDHANDVARNAIATKNTRGVTAALAEYSGMSLNEAAKLGNKKAPAQPRHGQPGFESDEHDKAGELGSMRNGKPQEYVWSNEQNPDMHGQENVSMATAALPKKVHQLDIDDVCDASPQAHEFRLTHGDLVMLSGDEFDPREYDEQGRLIPDNLWKMARTLSTAYGTQRGTQDEIIYAIYKLKPNDPRFDEKCTKEQPSGGAWARYRMRFTQEIKDASKNRYLRLAAHNRNHFAHADESTKGVGAIHEQATGAYRGLHETALWAAYQDARAEKDRGRAMAHEAAAQHFLTDSFSSGHIRTPRASIQNFWKAKYPNFHNQFVAALEQRIVAALLKQHSVAYAPSIVLEYFTHSSIATALKTFPRIEFGDMLSKIAHDEDNETGLWVINDIGESWKAFGDGKMFEKSATGGKPQTDTSRMTIRAVQYGLGDIDTAFKLGTAGQELTPISLFERVRMATPLAGGADANKYAPERIMPHLDPAHGGEGVGENGALEWAAKNFAELWDMPLRTTNRVNEKGKSIGPVTWSEAIITATKPQGAFYKQLSSVADDQEESSFGFNPKKAFKDGVLVPLSTDPRGMLLKILGE